ncbi:MAG: shikimate kinase [Alteromonadales bacterium]|nr:shikimate kinase [Alteromonadales bacterium]MCP4985830.1 shikimate kinase [Colwellia sp.]
MRKVLIFGNSASGKSTLAKQLAQSENLAHLDLDLLAWQPTNPPTRTSLDDSRKAIEQFIQQHTSWVIEGCYTDLLTMVEAVSSEVIFMNLPVTQCIANAKNRPWEPHKYDSKEAQDANLAMLIEWISQYESREDTFSKNAHTEFYQNYSASKKMITGNS